MGYDITKLRLEIEVPTEGAPNIVRNPSGEKGTSGWETPLTNQTWTAAYDSSGDFYYLWFRATGSGAARAESSMLPAVAGKFYSARHTNPYGSTIEHRTRLEFYDANRTLLSQGNQSGAFNGTGTNYTPSAQAPTNAVYVKLRIDFYISGSNPPTASFSAYFTNFMVTYADSFVGLGSVRTNLVRNPSFESNLTGWVNRRTAESSIARSATQASVGSNSLRIINTHNSNPLLGVEQSGAYEMPVKGNRYYAYGIRVYSTSANRRANLFVSWKNGNGDYLGYDEEAYANVYEQNGPRTGVGQWTQLSAVAYAPSGAKYANVRLDFGTGDFYDNFNVNETFYVDAAQFEEADVFNAYFDGNSANATGLTHAWTGTTNNSTSTRTTSGDGYDFSQPNDWASILGPTSDIKIDVQALDRGSLTATIQDAMLDPAVSETIRPGRTVRLQTFMDNHWESRFEGKVANANTVYNHRKRVGSQIETFVTLTANDCLTDLANQREARTVPDINNTAGILEGKGVQYVVNGSSGQATSVNVVAYNENASVVDQLAIARDSVLGYVWVDRNNVVNAFDKNKLSSGNKRTFANGDYTDISVDFNMQACINQVIIKYLRYDIGSGATTEVAYGPYVNSQSVAEWGAFEKSFTVAAATESASALATLGQKVLTANAVPKVRCNSLTFTVRDTATLEDAATLDLYDKVLVQTANLNESYRITGMTQEITPERWSVTLTFDTTDSVAAPTLVPSPPITGISIATAQAGFVQMFAGVASKIPQGWLLCDGSSFNQNTYPRLYAALGNSNVLPDLRGRMPIGAGTFATVGQSDNVTNEADRTPQHNHGLGAATTATNTATTGGGTRITGGNTGISGRNQIPFYALHYIIKA